MPDRLYEDIERAIDQRVDGHLFQRCAIDLLREAYFPDPCGMLPSANKKTNGTRIGAGRRVLGLA